MSWKKLEIECSRLQFEAMLSSYHMNPVLLLPSLAAIFLFLITDNKTIVHLPIAFFHPFKQQKLPPFTFPSPEQLVQSSGSEHAPSTQNKNCDRAFQWFP